MKDPQPTCFISLVAERALIRKKNSDKTTQLAAGAEAQAGAKINLLTKITAGMGIDGSADASREGRSILSKAIESTVLTDYIRCTENEAKSHITVFTKCKPLRFSWIIYLLQNALLRF